MPELQSRAAARPKPAPSAAPRTLQLQALLDAAPMEARVAVSDMLGVPVADLASALPDQDVLLDALDQALEQIAAASSASAAAAAPNPQPASRPAGMDLDDIFSVSAFTLFQYHSMHCRNPA